MDEAVGGSRAELLDGPNCCVLQVVDEMARDPGEQRIVNSDFEVGDCRGDSRADLLQGPKYCRFHIGQ